jgi:hypothetical protein
MAPPAAFSVHFNRKVTREGFCLAPRMNLTYRSRDAFLSVYFARCTFTVLSARSEVSGEIHFQCRDGLIWLKVNIAGKSKSLNFLLDSGAGISDIDLRTARTLGILLGSRQIMLGVKGGLCFSGERFTCGMRRRRSSKNGLGCRPPRVERLL